MEEEIKMREAVQGDGVTNKGEPSVDNNPIKRGRGRPQGSKKLKVCVTDVNLMELVSGISNGGSPQPQRGRGRPKLSITKNTVQTGSGDSHADNAVKTHKGRGRPKGSKKQTSNPLTEDHTPRKRGRPKKVSKSSSEDTGADLPNGGSNTPKGRRGRPKGSFKRKSESLTSGEENESTSVTPRKRGRPKGSPNKKPRLEAELSSEGEADTDGSLNSSNRQRGRRRKVAVNYTGRSMKDTSNGISSTPRRGRGRPRKNVDQKSGELVKRGRGRPKGSLNKKPPAYKVHGKVGRPRRIYVSPTKGKRGRPRRQPAKRGRPRKYPLPSPDELKKPKVWKPLGRPRKYPRIDPPEGTPSTPRRSRGRPRKSESKKGAHLRKNMSPSPSSPHNPNDRPPRKRGRPPSVAKSEDVTPRKRGRPKGSLNKNKARSETEQLDRQPPNYSEEMSDSFAVVVKNEGDRTEDGGEHNTQTAHREQSVATEETLIEQDASFEVSNRA